MKTGRFGTGVAAIALTVVSLASAQSPNPTLLVLQPADVPQWVKAQGGPKASSDSIFGTTAVRGRLASAESFYVGEDLGGGLPFFLVSRADLYRDATAAHQAYLAASAELARRSGSSGSAVPVGQEARAFASLGLPDEVVWRHGNVLAFISADGRGPGTDDMDYAPRQQARIAALVSPADPGPPPKPVIGQPKPKPAQARAGSRFAVVFPVSWSDGTALTGASVSSQVAIAGKPVLRSYRFKSGQFAVSLRVPRSAKGMKLRITATVRAEGRTAKKAVTFVVR